MVITIVSTLISIAVGGLIAFLVTRWYYERASEDLKREAKVLRERTLELEDAIERTKHHIISLGESLEEAGTTRLKKGEDGEWLRTVGKSFQALWKVEANNEES